MTPDAPPGQPGIYLDWNASAPPLPEVVRVVAEALAHTGNPSSVHRFGRAMRARIENARQQIAALAGIDPGGHTPALPRGQVILTSGGTEAAALALHGLACRDTPPAAILVSAVEHPCVLQAALAATARGLYRCCDILPVSASGIVEPETLARRLEKSPVAAIAIQLANNETGVLQPLPQLAALAHAAGALVLCDAVQAAGKIPLSMHDLQADALFLSAHKLGGPQGSGALAVRSGLTVHPLVSGGGQERGQRGGTPNSAGIAGFGLAAELAALRLAEGNTLATMTARRDALAARLKAAVPSCILYGEEAPRLPNTLCLGLPGVDQQRQLMVLDLAGIAVSAGSACSSGKLSPSPVILAMTGDETAARQCIRLSFGHSTPDSALEAFVEAWSRLG